MFLGSFFFFVFISWECWFCLVLFWNRDYLKCVNWHAPLVLVAMETRTRIHTKCGRPAVTSSFISMLFFWILFFYMWMLAQKEQSFGIPLQSPADLSQCCLSGFCSSICGCWQIKSKYLGFFWFWPFSETSVWVLSCQELEMEWYGCDGGTKVTWKSCEAWLLEVECMEIGMPVEIPVHCLVWPNIFFIPQKMPRLYT